MSTFAGLSPPPGALHVAVAVIVNTAGAVLISRRSAGAHQGGLWEFPGGKVDAGEAVPEALRRELKEELGLNALRLRPLIQVDHHYPDRRVYLDVWQVSHWEGTPCGHEGQPLRWVLPAELNPDDFPVANWPIIQATRLPPLYVITPDPAVDESWLDQLESALIAGVRLLQYRSLSPLIETQVGAVIKLCHRYQCRLLVNTTPEAAARLGADGVHLNSKRLQLLCSRPLPEKFTVGASCHTAEELAQARRVGADFAVLGPVRPTASHPLITPLGWTIFAELVARAGLPVYALGGLEARDAAQAWSAGAQGLAMIRGIWSAPNCAAAVHTCLSA